MEKIMQYMWQWRLYGESDRQLVDGRSLRIVHPGTLNTSSGPDFFNARVDIDGMAWAGNVELHLKASDWHRHGHDKDLAYDSVILHVVSVSDTHVTRSDGSGIPQLLLPFNEQTAEQYSALCHSSKPIRCASWIRDMPRLNMLDWLERAGMERLEEKSERLKGYIDGAGGDWSQGLFVALARALGFGLNSEPFERLARSLPLNIIGFHSDSLFELEALLLGCAGLLTAARPEKEDSYYFALREEFLFLAHRYSLTPLPASVWRMSGTRPGNMPHRKLAFLARLLQRVQSLFSEMIEAQADVEKLMSLFDVEFDGYWEHHFTFGPATARSYKKAVSEDMAAVLLINVVAPLYHAYGVYRGDYLLEELGEALWRKLPAERNSVMKMWDDVAGFQPADAFESQALLHIKRQYCERGECLHCRMGHKLLRATCGSSRTSCRRV
ncbi:MAG: DUF2851 family protein [Prevotella sp.]|nr:DUF2851 family protein [Prevotella sp.]MCM1074390.1 DUF2851 family protein [Ruminococcus sp.]